MGLPSDAYLAGFFDGEGSVVISRQMRPSDAELSEREAIYREMRRLNATGR